MIRLVTLTVIFMLLAISGTGCTNPAGAEFPDRPSRVNIDIALQQAAAMRARGKLDDAIISLEEAVYWGSADALKQLERDADAGHELANEVLNDYYFGRGNLPKSMEYYYRLAKINPTDNGRIVGLLYVFNSGQYHGLEEDRRRGRECLELAAPTRQKIAPAIYALLVDLASDGLIEQPSEDRLSEWRKGAAAMDTFNALYLAAMLELGGLSTTSYPKQLRRYQDKWTAEAKRPDPAKCRSTVVDGNKGTEH